MSSRRPPQQRPAIDGRRLLALVRESEGVVSLVTHDHDYPSYRPAVYACCYAIIRIGEGVRRLDERSRRRLRSASLAIWEEARNALAHDLDLVNHASVLLMIANEMPLLLSDLERLAR